MQTNTTKWTHDAIAEIIKGFPSLNQFRKAYPNAYHKMKEKGWHDLKELIPRRETWTEANPKWTRERIAEAISDCSSISEVCQKYNYAYQLIHKKGWLDLLEPLKAKSKLSRKRKWTYEAIQAAVGECSSVKEFRRRYGYAAGLINANGWDELTAGLPYDSITSGEEPTWSVYKWHFPETHAVYIGLSRDVGRRLRDEYNRSDASPVHDYLRDTGCSYIITILHDGLYSSEAAELEIANIAKYRADGYVVLNRNRGGSLGSYVADERSDGEVLRDVFSKYKSYKEFRVDGGHLYSEAHRRGLLSTIMRIIPTRPPEGAYTEDGLRSLISGYSMLSDFRRDNAKEYRYIMRHGLGYLLDELNRRIPGSARKINVSMDELDKLVDMVNRGVIGMGEACRRAGTYSTTFKMLSGGKLLPKKERARLQRTRSNESIIEEVREKYTSLAGLAKSDPSLLMLIKRRGIYKDISSMLVHRHRDKLSMADVQAAVDKCTNYTQFQSEYPSEYQAALRNGWRDIIDALPKRYNMSSEHSSYEHIVECLRQCSTRTEFNKRFRHESYTAKKQGIYADLVKDMPKMTGKTGKTK